MEHITASDIMRIREFCGKEVESRGSEICDLAIEGLRLQAINAELVAALRGLANNTENFWAMIQGEYGVKLSSYDQECGDAIQFFDAINAARAALSKAKGE